QTAHLRPPSGRPPFSATPLTFQTGPGLVGLLGAMEVVQPDMVVRRNKTGRRASRPPMNVVVWNMNNKRAHSNWAKFRPGRELDSDIALLNEASARPRIWRRTSRWKSG